MRVQAGSVWNNCWWGDPVILGRYPEEGLQAYGSAVPQFKSSDFDTICQPIDFYGTSMYEGLSDEGRCNGTPSIRRHRWAIPGHLPSGKKTPECLYWGPRFFADHYKLPLVITESGMSNCDWVSVDGRVHDPARIEFMNTYLLQLQRALNQGIDVRGFFAWSFMDNFEWGEGYKQRYGLVHVDFVTQQRTLKDSAYWYRELISSNGTTLEDIPGGATEKLPYIVKGTLRYIHTHVGTPFLVKDIATHLRCHPDFLSRKFKQHVSVDLSCYIRKARIERAQELLKNQNIRVAEVAEQSGFIDPVNFSKVFHRTTGLTPSQFKQQYFKKLEGTPPISIKPRKSPGLPGTSLARVTQLCQLSMPVPVSK